MNGRPRLRRLAPLFGLSVLALLGLLARARAKARKVPLSSVTGDWFVGPTFVERRGLATGETPAGELEDVSVLAGETFDPAELDPAVRDFYEETAGYDLRYRVRWYRPFRTGAAVASRLTSRLEQLNLPAPGDADWHRMASAFLAVDEPGAVAEPGDAAADAENDADTEDVNRDEPAREGVRAWVRTDPETGEAVFVALYATHHRDGDGFVNITAPVPGGGVDTILRPENLARGGGPGTGIRLTTEGTGDPGLYLRTPLGAFAVPGGQAFEVWREDGELRATHRMWLLGRTFLTVEYEMEK